MNFQKLKTIKPHEVWQNNGKREKNVYQSRLKKETMQKNGREKEEMGKGYMAVGEEEHIGLELFGKFIFHNY